MKGVLSHQIAAAYQGALGHVPGAGTILPGGLWFGKVPPATAVPYATFGVEQVAKEVDSKGVIETNRVQIAVYSDAGIDDGGRILAALAEAWDEDTTGFQILGVFVIRVRSETPGEEIPDQRRDSKDVAVGKLNFRFVTNTPRA